MDWTLGFLFQARSQQETVALDAGRLLRLTRARGRRIVCRHGRVWITTPGEADDVFLRPGEHWTAPGNGLVLVEAIDRAVVTLGC